MKAKGRGRTRKQTRTPKPTPPSLNALLTAAGLSQRALAGRLQVDPSYVSHIVLGRKQPSLRRATRIAKELGVSLDELQKSIAQGDRQ